MCAFKFDDGEAQEINLECMLEQNISLNHGKIWYQSQKLFEHDGWTNLNPKGRVYDALLSKACKWLMYV